MKKKSLLHNFSTKVFAIGLLTLLLWSGNVKAQQFFTAATSSYNNFPFNGSSSSGNMCQFLYMPSSFNTTPTSQLITVIYFKAATSATAFSYTNMLIKLGNTSLTSLTSGTWNAGLTTVYNQASVSWTFTSGNWFAITLSTPFLYTGGNLIVEASQAGTSGGMGVWYYSAGVTSRMYGTQSSSTSTGADTNPLSFGFDGAPPNCSGTPLTPTITTAPFTPSNPLCAGTNTILTATDPNLPVNGMAYQWQTGSSSTGPWTNVTGGSGATTLVYTTAAIPATTWYRIGAICTNSLITTYSAAFQVVTGAPQPSAITGNSLFCPGDPLTYTVTNVGGTTYAWTLPVGWTGFSTTNSITVTPGSTAGTISVIANSSCGTSVARTFTVSPGSAPGVPGAISGNNLICSGTTQTYSVTPVAGAMYYTWTLPSGWTGTSTTNSITTTTNTTSGNVSVKSVNGCGSSSSASTMAVGILLTLANPGTITGSDTVCSGTLQTYSIAPVPGASVYTWSFPSGWSGTTSGTSIQLFPGTVSGSIQVTAAAACATSPISTKAITSIATQTPSITISTPSTTLCQGIPISFTATSTNGGTAPNYQWKKNGTNVPGVGNSYTDNLLVTGDVISAILTSSLRCKSAPSVTSNSITTTIIPSVTPGVSINTNPTISICKGSLLSFTTTSTGVGTAPHYQWYKNGVILLPSDTLTTYSSSSLLDKDTLTIQLTTNAVCATSNVVGSNKVGVTVTDTVKPTISITADKLNIKLGDIVTYTSTITNGGATPTYQWIKNGVNIPGETNSTMVSNTVSGGDYISVSMESYALCANPRLVNSGSIIMLPPLGVGGVKGWEGSVSLYPNPTSGQFTVSTSFGSGQLGQHIRMEVLNVLGQTVYESEIVPTKTAWSQEVKLSEKVSNGRYLLRLSSEGVRATLPFVLNR